MQLQASSFTFFACKLTFLCFVTLLVVLARQLSYLRAFQAIKMP
jgi:hypothetical protein